MQQSNKDGRGERGHKNYTAPWRRPLERRFATAIGLICTCTILPRFFVGDQGRGVAKDGERGSRCTPLAFAIANMEGRAGECGGSTNCKYVYAGER